MVHVALLGQQTVIKGYVQDSASGEPIELVVRAQNFKVLSGDAPSPEPDMNSFKGTIKDRSYMGGEISYFVELENGTIVHAIDIAKLRPLRKGTSIQVHVAPRHCGLLKVDQQI